MERISIRRLVSTIVLTAMVASFVPLPASAAEARIQGRVTAVDGVTPVGGVTVTFVDPRRDLTYSSTPTDVRGAFDSSVPPGTYRLVAETPRGAYLASGAVRLGEGTNPPVVLSLRDDPPPEGQPGGGTEPPQAQPPQKDSLPAWAKWTIVGGLVVAGFLVIDAVTEDENPASGF